MVLGDIPKTTINILVRLIKDADDKNSKSADMPSDSN